MTFLKNYEIQHLDENYDFLIRHLQDATQNNQLQITKDGLDDLINVLKHNIVLEEQLKDIKDEVREEGYDDGYEEGYDRGYEEGYDRGYDQALADNNIDNY